MNEHKTDRYFEFTLRICGTIIVATGLIALAGWVSGVQILNRISPRYVPTALDTALAFVVFGILFLSYHQHSAHRSARALKLSLAVIIGVYGLLKALEFPLDRDLTFATTLFPAKEFLGPYVVGRMSPISGALFFVSGVAMAALLANATRHRLRALIGGTGVVVCCIGFLTTYAYLLNAPFFYHDGINPLAAPTAFAFTVLGIGLVVAAGPEAVLRPFVGQSTKSRTLRLFVPLVVLTCFAQEVLHDFTMSAMEIPRAAIILFVPLAAALIAASTGERLARYLSSRLHESERLLEESEERYRSMIEHAHDLIWALDRQGNFTYFNRRCEEVSGYKRSEWVGRSFAPMLSPEDVPRMQGIIMKTLHGEPQEFEVVAYRADGSRFMLEVAATAEYRGGEIVGIVSFGKDITERKQAEEALRENVREMEHANNVLEQILESIPVRVFWKDRDSKYLGCNTRFAQDAGLNRAAELAERTDYEMGWKDQAELYRADDQEVMGSGCSKLNIVEPQTTPDGKTIWLSTSKVPLRSSTGEVWGVLGLYEEITERKRAEEALQRQNEYLTALQETTLDLLAEHDLDRLLEGILTRAGELVGTTSGWLDLVEPGATCLAPKIALGVLATESRRFAVQKGEGLSGRVWQSGQPIAIEDYDAWPGRIQDHGRNMIRSIVGVPLLSGSEVLGVLGLAYDRGTDRIFDEGAISVLSQFAQMASLAIEGARLLSVANRELIERRQAEEALRESEERFRQVTETAGEWVWEVDAQGLYRYSSSIVEEILGYTPEELVGKLHFYDLFAPEVREEFKAGALSAFARKESFAGFVNPNIHKNGNTVILETNGVPILDAAGALLGYRGADMDVTKRKWAEEEREQSLSLLEATLESTADGILVVDAQGRVAAYNHRFLELWRIPEDLAKLKDDAKLLSYVVSQLSDPAGFLAKVQDLYAHPREESYDLIEFDDGRCFERLSRPQIVNQRVMGRVWSFRDITERRHAEEALREKEERLQLIFDNLTIGVYRTTPDGKVLIANPALMRMFGCSSFEELAQLNLETYGYAPSHPRSVFRARMEQEGQIQGFESAWKRPDGLVVYMRENARAVRGADGTILYYEGTAEDTTQQREAEAALRRSEKLLRDSQSVAHLGSYELDISAGMWTSSPELDDLFGIDGQFARTVEGWLSLIHPEWREAMAKYFATEVLGKGKRFDKEYKIVRNIDGQECWVHGLGDLTLDDQGRPVRMIGTIQNISERKQADESLRRLQQAVDTSGEVIFMTDVNGTFTYVNPAFTALYGYAAADVVGKTSPRILKSGLTDAQTYSKFWKTLQQKEIFRAELINRTKDGRNVTVEVSVNPVVSERGEVEGFLAVQRDMSERTRAEEERHKLESQLRQAQKMETIGTLAGGVAHDFNNILTPILVYSEMAAKHLGHDHPTRSDLEHVIAGATRAKDLVKQILTFSRQTEHERIPIELSPIVKEALKLLQASFPSTIEIEAKIQAERAEVMADPSQIHQVLMNLCTNAYHAMRDGGKLTVKLEAIALTEDAARAIPPLLPGEFVRLTVADTGCGMDEKTLERIFEPFFTTKKVGEGTGLGLSVVHGIVVSHGGAITVQSEVGKGSVFEIYLPQIGATSEKQVLDQSEVVGGDEHILVVDDEPEVADVLKDVLEEVFGYTVTVRTSSVDALQLLHAQPHRFDLVITDLTMPHLAGDRLAREILAIRKDLPIILMTGFSETINEERCRQLGIAGFLLKPPLSVDLARLVRKVLDGVSA